MGIESLKVGRHVFSCPENEISQVGRKEVQDFLHSVVGNTLPENWDWRWTVTGRGEFVGAFPKRVAKFFHKNHSLQIPNEAREMVGNLASKHCVKSSEYYFEIRDEFHWAPGTFDDHGSCYWNERREARLTLQNRGALAACFFRDKEFEEGMARAWVLPPPLSTKKDSFVLFNSYGMELVTVSRVLSSYCGHLYYKRLRLRNQGDYDGSLWINNSGTGYIVGPEESVNDEDDIELGIDIEYSSICPECGKWRDMVQGGDWIFRCEECHDKLFVKCKHCRRFFKPGELVDGLGGDKICKHCSEQYIHSCCFCKKRMYHNNAYSLRREGDLCCRDCYHSNGVCSCSCCGYYFPASELRRHKIRNRYYCERCSQQNCYSLEDLEVVEVG